MHCPFCTNEDTQVKDSRQAEDGATIRRRRICGKCDSRFTTYERIQLRELTVIKKDGKKKPFNRDKLVASIGISLRKRPVSSEQLEISVNNIVKNLESLGEIEIKSDIIGQMVMETLKDLDPVAYVRFASVYREFREAKDFEDFIGQI